MTWPVLKEHWRKLNVGVHSTGGDVSSIGSSVERLFEWDPLGLCHPARLIAIHLQLHGDVMKRAACLLVDVVLPPEEVVEVHAAGGLVGPRGAPHAASFSAAFIFVG